MRTELELVIIAIMLLVAALVVLTIFGSTLIPFGWFASTKNICISQFTSICQSTGGQPSDWGTLKYKDPSDNQMKSCAMLAPTCQCTPGNPSAVPPTSPSAKC